MDAPIKYVELPSCTLENLRQTLAEHGVAYVKGVVPKEECERLGAQLRDELAKMGIKSGSDMPKFFPHHSMLLQHYHVGHFQTCWDVRQRETVIELFAAIHKTRNLLTSFDGFSVHFPPEETGRGAFRGNKWMHTDQDFGSDQFCIQGLVNLREVRVGDATLVAVPGSHLLHAGFQVAFPAAKSSGNWYKLAGEAEYNYVTKNGAQPEVAFVAEQGSMLFWDSRTFHFGKEADRGRAAPNTRMVVYVCMTPLSWAKPAALEKRCKAFIERRTTTHWPHIPTLFPKWPRSYGAELPPVTYVPSPVLTWRGATLIAGYDRVHLIPGMPPPPQPDARVVFKRLPNTVGFIRPGARQPSLKAQALAAGGRAEEDAGADNE